jgi:hypothetical protein
MNTNVGTYVACLALHSELHNALHMYVLLKMPLPFTGKLKKRCREKSAQGV